MEWLIGGGMAGAACIEGIREVDSAGSIGIISAETDRPYNRPPLSKGLWKGDPLLETFADWKRPNEEGVVYYLNKGPGARCLALECVGTSPGSARIDRKPRTVYQG